MDATTTTSSLWHESPDPQHNDIFKKIGIIKTMAFDAVLNNSIDLLKESTIDCDAFDTFDHNLLHNAAMNESSDEIIDYLVENCRKSINTPSNDMYKRTPLMMAAWYARPYMVKKLLENGADMTLVDYDGKNALHYANYHPLQSERRTQTIKILEEEAASLSKGGVSAHIIISLLLL